jgi:hypothetical protein
MKLGSIAASVLLAFAPIAFAPIAFAPAALAQGEGNAALQASRMTEADAIGIASRNSTPEPTPQLESARPAAGMLPAPTGPMRYVDGSVPSLAPAGGDIRSRLRND